MRLCLASFGDGKAPTAVRLMQHCGMHWRVLALCQGGLGPALKLCGAFGINRTSRRPWPSPRLLQAARLSVFSLQAAAVVARRFRETLHLNWVTRLFDWQVFLQIDQGSWVTAGCASHMRCR